ncbi:Dabb family protein [Clostridium lundense]|uniref:Dabb family protein n=1 Tax=Clostridium lundense TaxID=319475 RepID=UPI000482FBB9|nr:Dabb family protein [Clostridium lundense]
MIKHIVMWKLRDFSEEEKLQHCEKAKRDLEGLSGIIPELKAIEVGININKTPAAYDLVLYSEFENEEELNIYQSHPEHVKVGKFIKEIVQSRVVTDYNV